MADPTLGDRLGYRLVQGLARLLLRLFYGRIEIVTAGPVPPTGPVVLAANHHNSLVDALLLIAVVDRPLATLANAPLFRHPLVGPFLRLLGALPVHRRQEAGDDPVRNAALFSATAAALRAGAALLVFPEGRTQPEPALLPLRTGVARIVLEAEAAGSGPVALVPVGLVYHAPGTFRAGRALVCIGPAVPVADLRPLAATDPAAAVRALTARLADGLRDQMVEAGDRETLALLDLAETLWREECGAGPAPAPARAAWMRGALHGYRHLAATVPERLAALRGALAACAAERERFGAPGARVTGRDALWLGGLAGPALAGLALHGLPYRLTAAVVRRLDRTAEEEATDKLAAGLVLYPVAWALEVAAAGWLGGAGAAALVLAALVPTGLAALAWWERLAAARRVVRARLATRAAAGQRRARRAALAAELRALAALVPDEIRGEAA
jgi:1-acyl-sn-glycerol-3-phosphate acyltransferase